MKYLWLVILIVAYVVMTISSIIDIKETVKANGYENAIWFLDSLSYLWMFITIMSLFIWSLILFLEEYL